MGERKVSNLIQRCGASFLKMGAGGVRAAIKSDSSRKAAADMLIKQAQ
jgi:hypothetical protein